MFATLLGGLPWPDLSNGRMLTPRAIANQGDDADAALEAVIRAQEAAGLEPITDGRLVVPDLLDLAAGLAGITIASGGVVRAGRLPAWRIPLAVDTWRRAAALTDRAVKQALPGPYTLGRRVDGRGSLDRRTLTMAFVEALRAEVEALAAAGCPIVEIEELDAQLIGEDERERALFREAHMRLTDGATSTHLSLSIVGGSADTAGLGTILDAPYASLAVDLIAGPDNWRLVTRVPRERGIVAGVVSPVEGSDDGPELLVYAAHYAASTGGRGLVRVGLGTAGGLAGLPWAVAARKLDALNEGARMAALPLGEELAKALDPRAVGIRSAAYGRYAPRPAPTKRHRRGRSG